MAKGKGGYRHAAGNAGYFNARRLDQLADIHGGRLTLQAGIRRNDHLIDVSFQTLDQFLQAYILRADAKHRRNSAVQYMIDALVFPGLLIGCQIARILNHHDHAVISGRIPADRTLLRIRQGITGPAITDIVPRVHDRIRQSFHPLRRHI